MDLVPHQMLWPSEKHVAVDVGQIAGTRRYSHVLLPGWEHTPAELRTEMIVDLERFAETGELPKVATR